MSRTIDKVLQLAPLYARWAVGIGFLSAVADRLGLWGPPGAPGVAWGDFGSFLDYTATLNPWFPAAVIPLVGWLVTAAELGLGVALLVGWRLRETGLASAVLLAAFGVGMIVGDGVKASLDASVFAASAAALLVAAREAPRELARRGHRL